MNTFPSQPSDFRLERRLTVMNSAKGREVPKGAAKTGIGGGGGSGSNKPGNRNTTKGDIKSEKADLNPKIQVRLASAVSFVHLYCCDDCVMFGIFGYL